MLSEARQQNVARMVELSDASAVTQLMGGIRAGALDTEDATTFIRTRALRQMRLFAGLSEMERNAPGSSSNSAARGSGLPSGGALSFDSVLH